MFGRRYFGARQFGPRYFGDGGTGDPVAPPVLSAPPSGHRHQTTRRRVDAGRRRSPNLSTRTR